MRAPGAMCFSATSVGELKKTIESLSAPSTSADRDRQHANRGADQHQTSLLAGHSAMFLPSSAFEPQAFHQIVDAPQLVRIAAERTARIAGRGPRLVAVAQHHIGADEPQPSLDVGAVAGAGARTIAPPCRGSWSMRWSGLMSDAAAISLLPGVCSTRASSCWTNSVQVAPAGASASMPRQIAAASAGRPSCSAAMPRKKRRLHVLGIERDCALERRLRLRGDDMPLAFATSASPRLASRSAVSPPADIALRHALMASSKRPSRR